MTNIVKNTLLTSASLFAFATLSGNMSFAQSNIEEDIIVTATRVATPISEVGSSVTVINSEEIERSQAREVIDVLKRVPGVTISQNGGAGSVATVRMRGMEGYHTQIIIDGVEFSDPSTTQGQYDLGHLLITDIERIEIVRGPQSTLYGSDAMGGVIHIITKKGEGAPQGSLYVEAGSYATKDIRGAVRGSEGDLSYSISANYLDTSGFSALDENDGFSESDGYDNLTLNGNFTYAISDKLSLDLRLRHLRSHIEEDSTFSGDTNDNTIRRENSVYTGLNYAMYDGKLNHKLAYSYLENERDRFNGKTYAAFSPIFDSTKQRFEYAGNYRFDNDSVVSFGSELEINGTEQDSVDKKTRERGAYLSYQFTPIENLSLSLGGRIDNHSIYGDYETYRATASYSIDATDTRLHGSIGTGFRAPSLYELYGPFVANIDLQPEESRGWDIGFEQLFWDDRIILDVTYYNSDTKNLINYIFPTGYENVARAKSRGVETSISVELSEQWAFTGNYTYNIAENEDTNETLLRRPKHEGSATISWLPTDKITTDLTIHAKDKSRDVSTFNSGYATVDLAASYQLSDTYTLTGRIENLFDKEYQDAAGFGTSDLAGYIGVRASF